MKSTKSKRSQADKRLFMLSLVVFAATCLLVVSVISSRGRSASSLETPTPAQMMTLEPAILANMTSPPPAIDGELSLQVDQLEQQVTECPNYSDERRSQMEQHIEWLRNPSQIPPDLIPAFGAEPANRLIFGMSTFTSIEWHLQGSSTTSCLYPIGQLINQMLVAVGEPPLEEFNG